MAVGASVSHKIVGWDSDVHINPSNAAADAKKPKILDMVIQGLTLYVLHFLAWSYLYIQSLNFSLKFSLGLAT